MALVTIITNHQACIPDGVLWFLHVGLLHKTGKGKTRKRKNGNGIAEKRVKGGKAEKRVKGGEKGKRRKKGNY